MDIREFINQNELHMECERVPENPHMADDSRTTMLHFLCTLEHGDEQLKTYFSMGEGHAYRWGVENRKKLKPKLGFVSDKDIDDALSLLARRTMFVDEIRQVALDKFPGPDIADVLDCIAMEASMVENSRHFEDWAMDLGYDPDSRSAERTYNLCKDQARKLEHWLTRPLYDQLLWEVERE